MLGEGRSGFVHRSSSECLGHEVLYRRVLVRIGWAALKFPNQAKTNTDHLHGVTHHLGLGETQQPHTLYLWRTHVMLSETRAPGQYTGFNLTMTCRSYKQGITNSSYTNSKLPDSIEKPNAPDVTSNSMAFLLAARPDNTPGAALL